MRKLFLMDDSKLAQQVWLGKFIADKMHKIISKFKEEKETLRLMLNNKHRSHNPNSSQTRKNSRNSSTPFRCLFVWFSLETFLLLCKLSERQTEVGSEWKQINFEHFLLVFLHMSQYEINRSPKPQRQRILHVPDQLKYLLSDHFCLSFVSASRLYSDISGLLISKLFRSMSVNCLLSPQWIDPNCDSFVYQLVS